MMRSLLILPVFLGVLLSLSGCGKVGSPHPPGPADKVIYPRTYPAPD
ncbi:hypothetical protein LOC54_01340 [Acetobacter sp. AN02]|nr:hypothetical protein [Acetobacter sp. AN02]MDG6093767.1 hypothetical protein [Acetobacter sp. AN02]